MPTLYTWILSPLRLFGDVAIDPFEEFRYRQFDSSYQAEQIFLVVLIILFLALLAGVIVLAILLSKSRAELRRLKSGADPYRTGTPVTPAYPGYGMQTGQPIAPVPGGYAAAPGQPGYGVPAGYPGFAAQPAPKPPVYAAPQSVPPVYAQPSAAPTAAAPDHAVPPAHSAPASENGLPPDPDAL